MKAITLYQPWASAVAFEKKRYETRSRSTSYRGLLAIHAGKTTKYVPLADIRRLPFGAVVAICELAACVPTERIGDLSDEELRWGDFSPGRWAWELRRVVALNTPVAIRGAQGLWTVPIDTARQLAVEMVQRTRGGS